MEAAELERMAAERPAKRPRGGRDGGQGGEGGEADAFAKAKAAVKQAAGAVPTGVLEAWGHAVKREETAFMGGKWDGWGVCYCGRLRQGLRTGGGDALDLP